MGGNAVTEKRGLSSYACTSIMSKKVEWNIVDCASGDIAINYRVGEV